MNIQSAFPLLKRKINGKKIVYLDSAATTQKPACVLKKIEEYYKKKNANVHRGIHTLSEEATQAYEEARAAIAQFINADAKEIVFVRNTTEALNIAAMMLSDFIQENDLILTTELEHHSNLLPWQQLAKKKKARIEYIQIKKDGSLDVVHAIALLQKKPKILALTHMSNVLGTITPIKALTKKAHEQGTLVIVDGAQSIAHLPIDVKDLDVDFFAFSGHKLYGPMGIGVLYGKKELLEKVSPVFFGGEMIKEVSYTHATWNDIPWKFEAGTPNVEGTIGLAEAMHFMQKTGIEKIHKEEVRIMQYALETLKKNPHIIIYGPQQRGPIITFSLKGVHPHDVATLLDQEGVAIRSGHACAQPLIEKLGVPAICRASIGMYTTKEDINALSSALKKVAKVFHL